MKKWLSIIGTIGLTATSTTILISCEKSEKPNNNEENKPTPKPSYNPQQPPEGSNWKLILNISNENLQKEINIKNDKWYIVIGRNKRSNSNISFCKFNSKLDVLTIIGNITIDNYNYYSLQDIKALYRWDGDGEPQLPTIDKNTGEITDWKEQKGTE
uniref:Hypothetical lipoprotein transmembrane n=1 Tax=Spiroplasma citri TaxID=2133 RepID=Q14MM4_SPICI|nr:hypothetical lipoprotein transmembrane [Spiroplasma citri]